MRSDTLTSLDFDGLQDLTEAEANQIEGGPLPIVAGIIIAEVGVCVAAVGVMSTWYLKAVENQAASTTSSSSSSGGYD